MGNCLVKKLKGTVENRNLREIGEIRFDVLGAVSDVETYFAAFKTEYQSGKQLKLENINTGSSRTTINADIYPLDSQSIARQALFLSESGYKLGVVSKYDIIELRVLSLEICSFDIKELIYCPSLQNLFFEGPSAKGALSDIALNSSIKKISFSRSNSVKGSIESYVEAAVVNSPSKDDTVSINVYKSTNVTFHNQEVNPPSSSVEGVWLYIKFSGSGTAIIYSDEEGTQIVASYNGSAWTYA